MPDALRYVVREAVLVPGKGTSLWRLTFAPAVAGDAESEDRLEEIVVTVTPEQVDDLYFHTTYTRVEIDGLATDHEA